MLRILFIVPDLKREGAQTQLVELINGLPNESFEKYLFTLENRLDQLDRVDAKHVRHFNMVRRHKLNLFGIARRVAKLIDEDEIDVVHCTLQFALLFGWAGRGLSRRKPKLVAALHTTQNRNLKEEWQDRAIYSPILRTCDRVIYVSEKQKEVWEKKFPDLVAKGIAIHNGVDTERFSVDEFAATKVSLRAELNIDQSDRIVACLAAFRPEKGHRFLIDAFKELPPNTHLVFAGEGPLLEEMRAYAKAQFQDDRIHFLGNVADVRQVLSIADVTVLASTAVETFSIAMLESMAMGVPVVATRLGGMEEAVLQGVTGALAEPGSTDSLVSALRQVLLGDTSTTQLGDQARQMVRERFTKQGMIRKTADVLGRL